MDWADESMEVLFGEIRDSLPLTVHAFDSGSDVLCQKHWRSLPLPNFFQQVKQMCQQAHTW